MQMTVVCCAIGGGGMCFFGEHRAFWLSHCDMFVLCSKYILQIKDELRARKEFDLI